MHASTFTILLAAVSGALASFANVKRTPADLEQRQQPDLALLACTEANYGGCSPFPLVVSPECSNFSFRPGFDNNITSFRSFSSGDFCLLYRDPDCQGANLADTNPVANLATYDAYFDNALSSYQCFITG